MSIFFVLMSVYFSDASASLDQTSSQHAIPDILVSFDSSTPAHQYALVVEKETQQLIVYEYNGAIRELLRVNCSTGKSDGAKVLEGDSKTPEGVYFFISQHEASKLAPIYGIGAYPTDYPNLLDQIAGRTGNAIWLHGTNKPLKPRDSNGCIVLDNSDLETVSRYITLNRTPLIITPRLSFSSFNSDMNIKESLVTFLKQWNQSLFSGTYHDYLSFYDASYLPDISWWLKWRNLADTHRTSDKPFSLDVQNISIFKHQDIYVVLFDQKVHYAEQEIPVGVRKFFVNYHQDRFKIIGDEYQVVEFKLTDPKEHPLVAVSRNLETFKPIVLANQSEIIVDQSEIETMLAEWFDAWSSKDIQRYGEKYANDFRSQGMNLKAWLNYKDGLNKKYDYIRVDGKDVRIKPDGDICRVSFRQTYESNSFKAVGIKQLILKQENGKWKIYREAWQSR